MSAYACAYVGSPRTAHLTLAQRWVLMRLADNCSHDGFAPVSCLDPTEAAEVDALIASRMVELRANGYPLGGDAFYLWWGDET